MISIIICSRKEKIDALLATNISRTIGVPYEVIVIDNSENKYSIFQAYNIGVERSQGKILCFMHDDVFFHTDDWGLKVLAHFRDEETGAIGVAGTPYATKMPGSWWGGDLVNQQLFAENKVISKTIGKSLGNGEIPKAPAVLLDGVWICIPKALFKNIKFTEEHLDGFHFYDIDICLQVIQQGYKIFTVFDVLIEHPSIGNLNRQWIKNALAINAIWSKKLPISASKMTTGQICNAEFNTLKEFSQIMIFNHYPANQVYWLVFSFFFRLKQNFFYYKTPRNLAYLLIRYLTFQFKK